MDVEVVDRIFGEGEAINAWQMSCRAMAVSLVAFLIIRIAGRRSFGIRTPVDNITAILLGAILSRAIVGASPFFPTVMASLTIAVLHRAVGWLTVHNDRFGELLEGNKILLYKDGKFQEDNMKRALVCEELNRQGVRQAAKTEQLEEIEKVYLDRNGEISVVKKRILPETAARYSS
ncbi:MAG: DUF421 domain-containing protein [Spirosomataceae bacterium]